MAIRLSDVAKKYETSWQRVSTFEVCVEDLQVLEPVAVTISSTWGRSVVLKAKNGSFKQYIPVDDKSSIKIGDLVKLTDILIQQLEKEGKTIYRVCLKSDI